MKNSTVFAIIIGIVALLGGGLMWLVPWVDVRWVIAVITAFLIANLLYLFWYIRQ